MKKFAKKGGFFLMVLTGVTFGILPLGCGGKSAATVPEHVEAEESHEHPEGESHEHPEGESHEHPEGESHEHPEGDSHEHPA